MLEYTLEDAQNLLSKNIEQAKKNLGYVEHDLHFLRYICRTAFPMKEKCCITTANTNNFLHLTGISSPLLKSIWQEFIIGM